MTLRCSCATKKHATRGTALCRVVRKPSHNKIWSRKKHTTPVVAVPNMLLVAGAVVEVVLAPNPENKLDPLCCCEVFAVLPNKLVPLCCCVVFAVLPNRLVPLCCCVFAVFPNRLDPLCCCVVFVFPNRLVVGFDVFPKRLPDDVDGAPEVAVPLPTDQCQHWSRVLRMAGFVVRSSTFQP